MMKAEGGRQKEEGGRQNSNITGAHKCALA